MNSEYTKEDIDALDLGSLLRRSHPDAVMVEMTPERAAIAIETADGLIRCFAADIGNLEGLDDAGSRFLSARLREELEFVEKKRAELIEVRDGRGNTVLNRHMTK